MQILRKEISIVPVEKVWEEVERQSVVDIRRYVHNTVFHILMDWGRSEQSNLWRLMGSASAV